MRGETRFAAWFALVVVVMVVVVIVALALFAYRAAQAQSEPAVSTDVTPTPCLPCAPTREPTATPFLGEPPRAFRPVHLPLVDNMAIPHLIDADENGVREQAINLDIYGFNARLLHIFPPIEENGLVWEVCWFGNWSTGWSEGGRCDRYAGVPEVQAWGNQ